MDLMYIRTRAGGSSDSGYLSMYEADFEIGTDEDSVNDFELKMPLPESSEGLYFAENRISSIVFVEGTEYGGIILGSVIDVEDKTITYTGRTWRGLLSQYIIEPPAGQDYRTVSGNLAVSIRSLPKHPIFTVKNTSYTGNTYQFERYVNTLDGINNLLIAADPELRFTLTFASTEGEYAGTVTMELVKTRDLSALVEISQDISDKIMLKITRDHSTPRHLICLGQGELTDREVIHLYADANWNISQTAISGAFPVETYDFSSSEDLLADGLSHYKELVANHEQIDVSITDLDVRLGDVISARDRLSGEYVKAEISNIIYKCTDYGSYQSESYEYKTKVRI